MFLKLIGNIKNMNKIVLLFVLFVLLSAYKSYAQYNSKGLDPNGRYDYEGHNVPMTGDGFDGTTLILLQVNGLDVTDLSMKDKFAYYFIGYYEFRGAWTYGTVGDIVIDNESVEDENNKINGTIVDFHEVEASNISTTPDEWGMWETIGITFYWEDLKSSSYMSANDGTGAWEVIIVNKESGYCVSSGIIYGHLDEKKINLIDPTLMQPSGPTLAVNNTAFCWSAGGNYDLQERVESVSDGATVKFYSDEACSNEISNVVSMAGNPTSSEEERFYWAKAFDDSGESDAQKITVTVYQKPEVTLAVDGGKTEVCSASTITLKTTGNSDNFGSQAYHYHGVKLDDPTKILLNDSNQPSSYSTLINESSTYFVYVNSVNNCKDTASVDVTVTPVIAGNDITIGVTDNKKAICEGGSVELSVAVQNNGKYSGTITYEWNTGATTESITVSPETTTEYSVKAFLNGCKSDQSVSSQMITVNELPTLEGLLNPDAVCSGTVSIKQSGDGYKYYSNKDLTAAVADPEHVAAGDYWITLTDANGCTSLPRQVTATVKNTPTPKILVEGKEVTADASLCAGTEITLTSDQGNSVKHTWTDMASGTAAEVKAVITEGENTFGLTITVDGCEGVAVPVKITGLKLPTVTITDVDGVCANSEVSLEATPVWSTSAGAKGVWTYNGKPIDEDAGLVVKTTVPAGKNTYTLTLTDGNGCEVTQSVDVMGNKLTLEPLTLKPSATVKVGDPVILQASASWPTKSEALGEKLYKRVWKKIVSETETVLDATGATLTDYPNISGTRYRVIAEKDGCQDSVTSDPVTVKTDPFQFPDPNNAITSKNGRFDVCYGEDLSAEPMKLYATVEGGSKEYTYKWKYPVEMTATASDDTLTITAIDYAKFGSFQDISVEISDGVNPTLSAKQTFSVEPIPQITINDVNNGAIVQACKEVALTLTAAIQGGGGSFVWSTGDKGASIAASTAVVGTSTYRVTATYGGCSNTDSVKVQVNELPKVSLVAQVGGQQVDSVCPGTEITLAAAVEGVDSPEFKWGQGASALNDSKPLPAVSANTSYQVIYKDKTTECTADAIVKVGVYRKVDLAVGVTPGSQVCPGTEVTMTVTNGDADTYVWTSSDADEDMSAVKGATFVVTPVSNTTYTISGKDTHGCEANPIPVPLEVRNAPTLELAKTVLDGCEGLGVNMAAAVRNLGNATLKVRNAAGDVLNGTNVTAAGTYTIYIDGGTCSSNEETVEVRFHELPTVTLAADNTAVCLGDAIVLSANGTGSTDLKYTPSQNWSDTPTSAGQSSYKVTVTDDYGCTATANTDVTVKPLPEVTIQNPGTVCAETEVTLQATGADSYEWTGALKPGKGDTYKVTPTLTSNTFTVVGTKNGCTSEAVSRTLKIQEAPKLVNVKSLEACVGMPVNLQNAFDAGSYTLTFYNKDKGAMAVTSIAALQLSDTLFYAKATQGNCSSDFVPVRVTPKPLPQLSISGLRKICQGDETTLTVEGNAASYAWSPAGKGGANSGAQMVVNPTTDTEYTITATGQNACTAETKWKIIVNPLPTLRWDSGNETALIAGQTKVWYVSATSGSSPYKYEWKHNGAVDENYTSTNYSLKGVKDIEILAVKVTDANGCCDSSEVSIPVTKLDELVIDIETDLEEGEELCLGNIAHLQVVTTKGALTSEATYKWTPADGLDVDDVANPIFTAATAGTHTYTVEVTEQDKKFTATVDLVVKNFEAPEIAWDESNPTSFVLGEGIIMKTVVEKGTAPYSYTWLKPGNSVDSPQYSIQSQYVTEKAYDFAVLMRDGNGCRTTDTLTSHLTVGGADAIEIEVEDVHTCPVPEGGEGKVTLAVNVTEGAASVTSYAWSAVDHTLGIEDADSPEAKVDIAGLPGNRSYEFTIVVTGQGGISKEETVRLVIESAPSVEIEETCLALYKDSTYVLNIVDKQEYDYTWTRSEFAAEVWGIDVEVTKNDNDGVTGQMGDKDVRYILTASISGTGCQASDTAFVWRIPDAPTVKIDTNQTKLDVKLTWDAVAAVDGYTVWSRKWDPYCLMSEDAAYTAESSTTGTEWAETNMDTLEFYYVTADKNVCGKSYHSLTSDTVGYKYDLIAQHSNVEKTSNSHIAWVFDMSEVGIVNASDILKNLIKGNCVIRAWEQQEQDWLLHQTLKNPLFGLPGFDFITDEYSDDFALQVGDVYQFDSPESNNELLQYGKLPAKFVQTLSSSDKGTNTMGSVPLHYSYCVKAEDLLRQLEGHVMIIRKWDYDEQDWLIQILKNPLYGIPGFEFVQEYSSGNEILRPGMVLQIDISELPQYIWK